MPHPLDRAVASDLSFAVLQLRTQRQELDSTNQPLRVLSPCRFDSFIADKDVTRDTYQPLRVQQ